MKHQPTLALSLTLSGLIAACCVGTTLAETSAETHATPPDKSVSSIGSFDSVSVNEVISHFSAISPPWQAEIPFKPQLGEGSYLIVFPPIDGIKAHLEGEEGNVVRFTGPLEVTGTVEFVNGADDGTISLAELPDDAKPPRLVLHPDWSAPHSLPLALVKTREAANWPLSINLGFQKADIAFQLAQIWGSKAAEKLLSQPKSRRIEYGRFKLASYSTFIECDHRYFMAEIGEYKVVPKSQQGRQLLPKDSTGC